MSMTPLQNRSIPRLLSGAEVGIPPRHLQFDFPADAQRYFFYDGNPLASLLFVVFSGVFPPGERFFVESVRHYRDRISDPVLKAQVAGFIGQEALHGREHESLNAFFTARGMAVDIPERYVSWGLRQLERLPPRLQLACTTTMEHFTAHLAEAWLTDRDFRAGADPEMLKLWSWHALEELEHKSVAYDVFEQVGGTRRDRQLAAALVIAAIGLPVLASYGVLLAKEGQLLSLRENRRGLRALFGRRGFISKLMPHMPQFWQAGFHPRQQDTGSLEATWRERLFGLHGELNAEFRNRAAVTAA